MKGEGGKEGEREGMGLSMGAGVVDVLKRYADGDWSGRKRAVGWD